jgi:5,10-methylenetetrahydromethanopterin reductase
LFAVGIVLHHGIKGGAEVAEYGRLAEEAGFESLWVTERYFHEETFSLLGYLAAVTTRIKLGLGVANPYTRNPALLAMAAATLDRLSGGRLILGLGRSEQAVVEGRMGIRYGPARATLRDTVAALRELLGGRTVSGAVGSSVELSDVRLALAPVNPRLPIYVAAIGPKGLKLAGAVADGVLLNAYAPTAYVRWAVEEVRRGALEAGREGRDAGEAVEVACMLVVRLTPDGGEVALERLKRRIARLLAERHVGEILLDKGGFDPGILGPLRTSLARGEVERAAGLIGDDLVRSFYLLGNASQCKERLAEYRRAGVNRALLLPRLEDYRRVATALGPGAG